MEESEIDMVKRKGSKRKRTIEGGDLRKREKRSKRMSNGDIAGLDKVMHKKEKDLRDAGAVGLEESNKKGNRDDKVEDVENKKKRKRNRNEEEEKAENMRKTEEFKNPKERSETNKRMKKDSKSEKKGKNNKEIGKDTATGNGEVKKKNENRKERKKVQFADEVEVFSEPSHLEKSRKRRKTDDREGLIWGERFTKEEDTALLKAIDDYIKVKQLGEKGREMVFDSKKHKLKGCWKDIAASLPHRPYEAIYYRARNLLQAKTPWTPEDYENLRQFQAAHGNRWRNFADMYLKRSRDVKDSWRVLKHANLKKGPWGQEEYQTLFDLVNTDLKLQVFTELPETHRLLRDNISWEAISDKLGSRTQAVCCFKWYRQLTSPLVHDNLWIDTDDYRLIIALQNTEATCIEEVNWDNLLPHREGEICKKRWQQMIRYIGEHKVRPFIEQLEILSNRYCPEMLEYRAKKDEEL